MARIVSAFARMPPVTSGIPGLGRRSRTVSSVTSGSTTRARPDPGARIPGTSLTKTIRLGRSAGTRASAIVSALRIELPHSSSGTTSPNETGA